MKTGHRAIQLHTYGPQPSTCVNLYVCMPSGSVLSVPGVLSAKWVYMRLLSVPTQCVCQVCPL